MYRGVTALTRFVLLIVLACIAPNVLSVDAFVRILTPSDGATLTAKGPNTLNYEAVTGASKGITCTSMSMAGKSLRYII